MNIVIAGVGESSPLVNMKLYSPDRRNGNTRIYDGGNADVEGVFDAHNACLYSEPRGR